MKISSYQEMLKEMEISKLANDDAQQREQQLLSRPFSVILEAGFMELDSLNKWIEINLDDESVKWIFYEKTGYNYGFAEYFSSRESDTQQLQAVIPQIFTIYPDASPPNQISKTNGYNEWVEYSEDNPDAIVVQIDSSDKPIGT